jgi:BCD family chlorophyll transporter-like MFS transporter
MKIEMGLDLGLVGLVIGRTLPPHRHSLGPIRPQTDPGLHPLRTSWRHGATAAATVAAPFVALAMEAQHGGLAASLLGLATFLTMGAGMYIAGTAYLSLIADLVPEGGRSKAISIVWSMMMVGILAGVFLGVGVLNAYSPENLISLFLAVALGVALLTVVAVWRQERAGTAPSPAAVSTRQAVALLNGRQPRLFFAFLCSGILFLFLQRVLEPFGGDVFGMSIQMTMFNARWLGYWRSAAGAWISPRLGEKRTAARPDRADLSFAPARRGFRAGSHGLVAPAILLMGVGMGFFNVGGLALMIGMSAVGNHGIFMGAWTLAQAVANGVASVGGGYVHDVALRALGSEPSAYAAVFILEAVGLVGTILVLSAVSPHEFRAHTSAHLAPA